MNNKYIARLSVASILFLVVPGVSLASDSASNTNTGRNSTNNATISYTTTTTHTNVNESNVSNNVSLNFNTGNNSANGNTQNGTVLSGDIDTNVDIQNVTGAGNNIFSNVTTTDQNITVSNSNTGNGSANNAVSNQRTTNSTSITNRSNAVNNVSLTANTGGNRANGNTGNGFVQSGDIRANVRINNQLNVPNGSNPIHEPEGNGGGSAHPVVIPSPAPTSTVQAVKPATKAEVVMPRPGVGGGYFPAGGNWVPMLGLLLFISFALSYSDKLSEFLARPIPVAAR